MKSYVSMHKLYFLYSIIYRAVMAIDFPLLTEVTELKANKQNFNGKYPQFYIFFLQLVPIMAEKGNESGRPCEENHASLFEKLDFKHWFSFVCVPAGRPTCPPTTDSFELFQFSKLERCLHREQYITSRVWSNRKRQEEWKLGGMELQQQRHHRIQRVEMSTEQ